jgi:hypothetical protein
MTTKPPKYCFMKPTEAEIVKISLNGFITTKISFANMISDLCDTLKNVNKATVLDAIGSDSRIGTKYFRPGTSFGGPCFPRDTKALKQLMDQNGIQSNILKATTEYNEEHIRFQTDQLLSEDPVICNKMQQLLTCDIIPFLTEDAESNLLNQSISTHELCDRGILNENRDNRQIYRFSNVCYKDNSKIPIIEESAKLKIAERLSKLYNKTVMIRDVEPIINEVKKEYGSLFNYEIE